MAAAATTEPAGPHRVQAPGRVLAALAELAREAPVELAVAGESMGARLPAAARLRVEAAARYRAGDILVFANTAGQLVAHRLLGVLPTRRGLRYVTRGDAAAVADGLVPPESVVGRVVGGLGESALLPIRARDRWRARARLCAYLWRRLFE